MTYARAIEGPMYKQWLQRYEAAYGKRETFSPQAYDAVNILLKAVTQVARQKKDGSLDIPKMQLRDAVRNIEMTGVTGDLVFRHNGDRTGTIVGIFEVQGDKFVEISG